MDMHHEAGYPNQTSKTAKPIQSIKVKEKQNCLAKKNQPINT
jgi:hypothetical protein